MKKSLVCDIIFISQIEALSYEGADNNVRKRRDNKGRLLKTGESQRTDRRYLYKYVDDREKQDMSIHGNLHPQTPYPKERGTGNL